MNTTGKGREGEKRAVVFLENTGYEIIERNYWSFGAEIDIIACKGKTLVFAEVKHWDAYGFREVGRAMNKKKRSRIAKASKGFLYDNLNYEDFYVRFDLIFVAANGEVMEHIEDAFTETEQL